jgi:hypothetical protein
MLDQRRQQPVRGRTLEAERVLDVDQPHALFPALPKAGEDADGAIEALHGHHVTLRLSSSRLTFDVCATPV